MVIPGEKKRHTRLVSSLGEWIATWGTSGLFSLALAEGNRVSINSFEPGPDWLHLGWGRYWNGEEFDASLCTEKQPAFTTAAVWKTVLAIPFGETLSYGEVAVRSGIPGAARAVGAIMRANPWALFLPCHRVIGKDGQMRGYGGSSGVTLKLALINFERRLKNKKEGGLF
jgi:methylated-DNA-[protein]-cysteine S-methyltransferase